MEHCVQMEASGSKPQEYVPFYRSRYVSGMLGGDMAEGTFVCGAGAGLIKEIKCYQHSATSFEPIGSWLDDKSRKMDVGNGF
jgi:hypothetical protein